VVGARPDRAPARGGWSVAGDGIGWTCCVEQGAYGHRARKATWLYAVRTELPSLTWRSPHQHSRLDAGYHSREERQRATSTAVHRRLTKSENLATPLPFRDLLLELARSVADRLAA
jgi:hypothetical protein